MANNVAKSALPVTSIFRKCCNGATPKEQMYQLIGGELSPFTAKVRSYLRYKKIPFEPVQASGEIYAQFIKPKVGWSVIPVLVTKDGDAIQDSTDIISYLEKKNPDPSIIPKTPKQQIVSRLLELFSDEWMILPIMHYRWSFPENEPFLQEEFGRIVFPKETSKSRSQAAAMVYSRFKGMLPILGITKKIAPAIEESWKAMLDDLTVHFDQHPYLLGGQPCIGDFALGGMFYAHLFRDPMPGFLMKTRAPLVAAWTEQMNGHLLHANKLHLHEIDSNGKIVKEILPQEKREFCTNDEIPETLVPILKRFFVEFGPVLLCTKSHLATYIQQNCKHGETQLRRNIGTHQFSIGNVTETRGIFPFYVWMWQHVTDLYASLPEKDRNEADAFFRQFPYGLDVVKADLSSCRVERKHNFLHAVLSPPKSNL